MKSLLHRLEKFIRPLFPRFQLAKHTTQNIKHIKSFEYIYPKVQNLHWCGIHEICHDRHDRQLLNFFPVFQKTTHKFMYFLSCMRFLRNFMHYRCKFRHLICNFIDKYHVRGIFFILCICVYCVALHQMCGFKVN